MRQSHHLKQKSGKVSLRLPNRLIAILLCALVSIQSGCVSWDVNSARRLATVASWGKDASVSVRKRPQNPLSSTLNLVGYGGPRPSERTQQVLRRYALQDEYSKDPEGAVNRLMDFVQRDPSLEMAYAWTELAYIRGHAAQQAGNHDLAMSWFCGAVSQSFAYLFDVRMANYRNAYDPVFRRICDLYNQSLEGMLRILQKQEQLRPNNMVVVETEKGQLNFKIQLEGRWQNDDIDSFKFVSDLNVQGLANQYRTFGLGVPLIAVRSNQQTARSGRNDADFYPPDLTFPLTAFFEVNQSAIPVLQNPDDNGFNNNPDAPATEYILHLYDPLETTYTSVNGQVVPLESDITTPLAYYLKDPLINTDVFATLALIDGEFAKQFRGLYMLEPYDPNKIPVLMVHGLWSSPITWTEMFNDLRADAEIRGKYQFWFYLYPSGQPFWVSANQMREDLAEAKEKLDPYSESRALSKMVLVGHSMGGLISRLQTFESGDDFWRIVSDQSFDQVKGDEESIDSLRDTLFFSANPSISRVVTLGTPHQGSNFANSATRWFSRLVFRLPQKMLQRSSGIVKANPDVFRDPRLFTINTSIDSLAPDSPFFEAMSQAQRARWVRYHNVVGQQEHSGLSGYISRQISGDGDGVVAIESAKSGDTISEVVVSAEHSSIHRHPRSIMEVRRILLEHLKEYDRETMERYDVIRSAERAVPQTQQLTPLLPRF